MLAYANKETYSAERLYLSHKQVEMHTWWVYLNIAQSDKRAYSIHLMSAAYWGGVSFRSSGRFNHSRSWVSLSQ